MREFRRDLEKLDLLHASVADAGRIIARSTDRIEETERILHWLRRLEDAQLDLRPPPERE